MARYRKIYPKLWTEPEFMRLTVTGKLALFYALSGPLSNGIGAYHCPHGVLDGAVGWNEVCCPLCSTDHTGEIGSPFAEIILSRLIVKAGDMIWIPSWWKWNPPENPNVATNLARQFEDVNLTAFAEPYAESISRYLPKKVASILLEKMITLGYMLSNTQRSPKRKGKRSGVESPNQEQEQEQDKKESSLELSRQQAAPFDWKAVIDRWNSLAEKHGRQPVRTLSDRRRVSYRARLRENPAFWETLEAELPKLNEHARNATNYCTFPWLIKSQENFLKLAEGAYRDNGRPERQSDYAAFKERLDNLTEEDFQ